MSELKRTLADLAERGTPIGADRLRDRVMLDLAPGSSSTPWSRVDARRPAFVILGAVAATLLLVGAVPLLFGWMGTSGSETASVTTVAEPEPVPPVVGLSDSQTVSVTVSDVSGYAGYELAGVLYAGGELTDLDRDALGGFSSVVDSDEFTTTEAVLEPGEPSIGMFPHVTDQTLAVSSGTYTLVVWVDLGLGGTSRWVPVNSDGMGLYGCQAVFEVADDARTDVAITANLVPNGWNTDCTTGIAIPGTDAAAEVAPPMDGDEMWWPELEMSMPPVVGEGDGQTINVTVSGVRGHDGDELAGVLYAGGELADLDNDALGGFWVVVDGDEAAATEVVREPGTVGEGRFPFIASQALTVAPGTYTLVMWVDDGLGPVSRWVPLNSDGMGLYGCQAVFEVADDAQTDVAITANLVPDGWNTDCTTGIAIPGTDAAAAVAPPMDGDEMWWPELEMSMPPVAGKDDGQTINETPTTVPPPVEGAVPAVWDAILATTRAKAAPPASTCPDGATPDVLGPVDQARPYGASWSNQAAAFDQHAGRIVFVDEVGEMWTFDVCMNTWQAMNPDFDTPGLFRDGWAGQLVYDVDSDLTISFLGGVLAVYDADTNTWTSRSQPEEYDTVSPGSGAVYDPVSGLVVVQTTSSGLVAYDVETDAWTPIGGIEDKDWPSYLIGYFAETDRLVLLNVNDGRGTLVDPRTGATAELKAPLDDVFAAFGRLDYATNTSTPYVVDPYGPDGTICRLVPTTYEWNCLSLADGPGAFGTTGSGQLAATVGDPINGRVALIYGYGPGGDGKPYYDRNEVWAINFTTGEQIKLLE